MAKWTSLQNKFVMEFKKINGHTPSGSASEPTTYWVWYKCLLFLIPYVKHLDMISSIPEDTPLIETDSSKSDDMRKYHKRKHSNVDDMNLVTLGNNLSETIKELKKRKDESYKSDKCMPLIQKELNIVPEQRKFKCTNEIIKCIKSYK